MTIDVSTKFESDTTAARKNAVTEVFEGLQGSQILAIATSVRAMIAEG